MSGRNYYEVDVPEGFEPMSRPTKDEDRMDRNKVRVSNAEERDLNELAALIYAAFPDVFWNKVEDADNRPPLSERTRRLAKHLSAFLQTPGYHLVKATHADSGSVMGVAIWIENGPHAGFPTSYAGYPGLAFPSTFVPCTFRNDLVRPLGWDKKPGWSDSDVAQMYGHHAPAWFDEFRTYDTGRVKEMGDRPHWYLAPICVKKEYRAMGVGKALMMYGLERADAVVPPVPCVLEALPNAMPVYYHFGYKATADHGSSKDLQMVRPPLGKQGSSGHRDGGC